MPAHPGCSDLLERAEQVDAEEDAQYGECGYEDLPAELHRREEPSKRIKEAKAALELGAREARAMALDEPAERHEAMAVDDSLAESQRDEFDRPLQYVHPSRVFRGTAIHPLELPCA